MSKIPEHGIASAHGDCLQNEDVPIVKQAESMIQLPQPKQSHISITFTSSKSDMYPHRADRFSQGDHAVSRTQQKRNDKDPCFCCKRYFNIPTKEEKPIRMMYWELPRPKFGGISVTAHDYKTYKLEKKEMPKWHPHFAQPWKSLDVPSITETTYKRDFAPPAPSQRRLPLRPRVRNLM